MKIVVIILAVIVAQSSAYFYDEFNGAVFSVQSSFGKLFNDVVTDFRDTVDCTILAVKQVLSDKTSPYYDKRCNSEKTSEIMPSSYVQPSELYAPVLDSTLTNEITKREETVKDELLQQIDSSVSVAAQKETQIKSNLENVENLLKNGSFHMTNVSAPINNDDISENLDITLPKIGLEQSSFNVAEGRLFHEDISEISKVMNSTGTSHDRENDIVKLVENNSNKTETDIKHLLVKLEDGTPMLPGVIQTATEDHNELNHGYDIQNNTAIKKYPQTFKDVALKIFEESSNLSQPNAGLNITITTPKPDPIKNLNDSIPEPYPEKLKNDAQPILIGKSQLTNLSQSNAGLVKNNKPITSTTQKTDRVKKLSKSVPEPYPQTLKEDAQPIHGEKSHPKILSQSNTDLNISKKSVTSTTQKPDATKNVTDSVPEPYPQILKDDAQSILKEKSPSKNLSQSNSELIINNDVVTSTQKPDQINNVSESVPETYTQTLKEDAQPIHEEKTPSKIVSQSNADLNISKKSVTSTTQKPDAVKNVNDTVPELYPILKEKSPSKNLSQTNSGSVIKNKPVMSTTEKLDPINNVSESVPEPYTQTLKEDAQPIHKEKTPSKIVSKSNADLNISKKSVTSTTQKPDAVKNVNDSVPELHPILKEKSLSKKILQSNAGLAINNKPVTSTTQKLDIVNNVSDSTPEPYPHSQSSAGLAMNNKPVTSTTQKLDIVNNVSDSTPEPYPHSQSSAGLAMNNKPVTSTTQKLDIINNVSDSTPEPYPQTLKEDAQPIHGEKSPSKIVSQSNDGLTISKKSATLTTQKPYAIKNVNDSVPELYKEKFKNDAQPIHKEKSPSKKFSESNAGLVKNNNQITSTTQNPNSIKNVSDTTPEAAGLAINNKPITSTTQKPDSIKSVSNSVHEPFPQTIMDDAQPILKEKSPSKNEPQLNAGLVINNKPVTSTTQKPSQTNNVSDSMLESYPQTLKEKSPSTNLSPSNSGTKISNEPITSTTQEPEPNKKVIDSLPESEDYDSFIESSDNDMEAVNQARKLIADSKDADLILAGILKNFKYAKTLFENPDLLTFG